MKEDKRKGGDETKELLKELEGILCSYQGMGHQSIYIDPKTLPLFSNLILRKEIRLSSYEYEYNPDIQEDQRAVAIYQELASQTRWRIGCHTQIEPVRMNALKQFEGMGRPIYCGHIYYEEIKSVVECGEILPYEIVHLFCDMPELRFLYVFPCPWKNDAGKALYYRFEVTETARKEMQKFVNRIFDMIREIGEKNSLI